MMTMVLITIDWLRLTTKFEKQILETFAIKLPHFKTLYNTTFQNIIYIYVCVCVYVFICGRGIFPCLCVWKVPSYLKKKEFQNKVIKKLYGLQMIKYFIWGLYEVQAYLPLEPVNTMCTTSKPAVMCTRLASLPSSAALPPGFSGFTVIRIDTDHQALLQ